MYNTANQPRKCIRDLWLHILVVWIWFDWRLSGTCRRRIWPINKPAAAMVGAWQFGYGGTSFATPIQAGEWALIESKVAATTGLSKDMGDVNPLLFLAHN